MSTSTDKSVELDHAVSLVLADLLAIFTRAYEDLDDWMDSLCGFTRRMSLKNRSIGLSPLVQKMVDILFDDPFLWLERARRDLSYQNGAVLLVNQFLFLLLQAWESDIPTNRPTLVLPLLESTKKLFAAQSNAGDENVVTGRPGDHPIPLIPFISEWVEGTLLSVLSQGEGYLFSLRQRSLITKDILLFCQHPWLQKLSQRLSPLLFDATVYLMDRYNEEVEEVASYDQLLCWAILSLRSFSALQYQSSSADINPKYLESCLWLFERLALLGDEQLTLAGRLTTEVVAILLEAETSENMFRYIISRKDTQSWMDGSDGIITRSSLVGEILSRLTKSSTAINDSVVIAFAQSLSAYLQHILHLILSFPESSLVGKVGESEEEEEEEGMEKRNQKSKLRRRLERVLTRAPPRWRFQSSAPILHKYYFLLRYTTVEEVQHALALYGQNCILDDGDDHDDDEVDLSLIQEAFADAIEETQQIFLTYTYDALRLLHLLLPKSLEKASPMPETSLSRQSVRSLLALTRSLCDYYFVRENEKIVVSTLLAHNEEVQTYQDLLANLVLHVLDCQRNVSSITVKSSEQLRDISSLYLMGGDLCIRLTLLTNLYALPHLYTRQSARLSQTKIQDITAFSIQLAHSLLFDELPRHLINRKINSNTQLGVLGVTLDSEECTVIDSNNNATISLVAMQALEIVQSVIIALAENESVRDMVQGFLKLLRKTLIESESMRLLKFIQPQLFERSRNGIELDAENDDDADNDNNNVLIGNEEEQEGVSSLLYCLPSFQEEVILFLQRSMTLLNKWNDKNKSSLTNPIDSIQVVEEVIARSLSRFGLKGYDKKLNQIAELVQVKKHLTTFCQSLSTTSITTTDSGFNGLESKSHIEQPSFGNDLLELSFASSQIVDRQTASKTLLTMTSTNLSPLQKGREQLEVFYTQSRWPTAAAFTRRLSIYSFLSSILTADNNSSNNGNTIGGDYNTVDLDNLASTFDIISPHLYAIPHDRESEEDVLETYCRNLLTQSNTSLSISPASVTLDDTLLLETKSNLFDALQEQHGFTQISSGNDLLLVLANLQMGEEKDNVRVKVRIYNQASFKVTFFTIHLLVSTDPTPTLLVPLTDTCLYTPNVIDLMQATKLVAYPEGTSVAIGGDYLSPGAMIERVFSIKIEYFAPFRLCLRIVYPDLIYDDTLPHGSGEAESPFLLPPTTLRYTAATAQHRQSGVDGLYASGLGGASSGKWQALLTCEPLKVPLAYLLTPYRGNSLSAYRQYYQRVCGTSLLESWLVGSAGIPWATYNHLFQRLSCRHSHLLTVVGCVTLPSSSSVSVSTSLIAEVWHAIWLSHGANHSVEVTDLLGPASVAVRTPACSYHAGDGILSYDPRVFVAPTTSSSSSSSVWDSKHVETRGLPQIPFDALGWGLQTVWGSGIAVSLLPELNPATSLSLPSPLLAALESGDVLVGQLCIRCEDPQVLVTILSEAERFVHSISGGYLSLVL
eukprot:scaffold16062_cov278-Ochromonas_danica.AAC.1